MEMNLNMLFDFQKFENNASLQAVINDVHTRYASRELSLDEMDFIAAAGMQKKFDKNDPQ